MSWMNYFNNQDLSLYTRCTAEYEIVYSLVERMEWRLNDFLSDNLIEATQNTLSARAKEITETLALVPSYQALPAALKQMLDVSESIVRQYLSEVVENTNSTLVRINLGDNLTIPSRTASDHSFLITLLFKHQAQHMSNTDLIFKTGSILSSAINLLKDLTDASSEKSSDEHPEKVPTYKSKVNGLLRSCEISEQEIELWLDVWASHLNFAPNRNLERDKMILVKFWQKTFVSLSLIVNNLHGVAILLQKVSAKEWDREQQREWLMMMERRTEKAEQKFRNLQASYSNMVLGMLTKQGPTKRKNDHVLHPMFFESQNGHA